MNLTSTLPMTLDGINAIPLVDHKGREAILEPGQVLDPHQPSNITESTIVLITDSFGSRAP